MAKGSRKKFIGLLGVVFGVIILLKPDILALLVALYLIIAGISNLAS